MPTIIDVRVTPDRDEPEKFVSVTPVWEGVDRPATFGWSCKKTLAPRLVRALRAGVVFRNVSVQTDVNGKTYVGHETLVSGRHMNADLTKLGF